jgi:hypothetical protein
MSSLYDDCPDHGLPGLSVCASCVRPLCRKCKVVHERCAECRAAASQRNSNSNSNVSGSGAAGNGRIVVVLAVIALGMLALTWKGCPGMPKDIVWLSQEPRR